MQPRFISRRSCIAWIGTFAIFSLWLEVNSAADRVIQRAVGNVEAFASHALDYFIDLMFILQGKA